MEKIQLRKVQTIGQAINDTFTIIARNFKPLFSAVFFAAGPYILAIIVLVGLTAAFFAYNIESNNFGPLLLLLVIPLILLITLASIIGTTIILKYIKLYVHSPDGIVDPAEIKEGLWQEIGNLFGTSFLGGLLTIAAFFCFIIPGIYVGNVLRILPMLVIEEKLTGADAIRRCFTLMKENWWWTFGFAFIIGIIVQMGSYVIQIPMMLVAPLIGMLGGNEVWIGVFSALLSAGLILIIPLLLSIQIVSGAIWYYGLAEKFDGTAALEAVDSIGKVNNDGDAESTWATE